MLAPLEGRCPGQERSDVAVDPLHEAAAACRKIVDEFRLVEAQALEVWGRAGRNGLGILVNSIPRRQQEMRDAQDPGLFRWKIGRASCRERGVVGEGRW